MVLRFDRIWQPQSWEELSVVHKAQLERISMDYDGGLRRPEERLLDNGDEEGSFHGRIDVCELVEGDELRYELWLYNVDSGSLFVAGTTRKIARIVQGYFDLGPERTDVARMMAEPLDELRARDSQPKRANPLPRLPEEG